MRDLNQYSQDYSEQPYEKFQVEFRRTQVIKSLNNFKARTFLEVGCGFEPLFCYFNSFESWTTVEPSEIFFAAANTKKKTLDRDTEKINILNNFFEEINEELIRAKPDVIIISSLLHEVNSPSAFLKHARSLCAPKSFVHVNVPNAFSLHRLLALEMGLITSLNELSQSNLLFQQHSVFDLNRLSHICRSSGFEIINSGTFAPKLFTHNQMDLLLKYNIICEDVIKAISRLSKYIPELGSEIYVDLKPSL